MVRKNKAKRVGPPMKKRVRAPSVSPRQEPQAPAPEPEIPVTKDGILAAMGALCDQVDALLAQPRAYSVTFDRLWNASPEWKSLDRHRDKLRDALRNLIGDEEEAKETDHNPAALEDCIRAALEAQPGTVPSFARPGRFLIWLDRIPICCQWDGFIEPNAICMAVDPRQPWLDSDGDRGMRNETIGHDQYTVESMFRDEVAAWTQEATWKKNKRLPTFSIVPLTERARASVEAREAEWEWLRPILRRGPTNPISLPEHIAGMQTMLA